MSTKNIPTSEPTQLSSNRKWSLIVMILAPTLCVWAVIQFMGEASGGSIAWSTPEVLANLSGTMMYTIAQVAGATIAFFAGLLCFARYAHSGEITTMILGVGLFIASILDFGQTLVANGLISTATPAETFVPLAWTFTRSVYGIAILMAALIFLISGETKGAQNRKRITVMSTASGGILTLLAVAAIYVSSSQPELASTLFGSVGAQRVWAYGPLALFLMIGLYVLPTYYRWHPSVFGQSLILGTFSLALGQLHFGLSLSGPFDLHFLAANVLRVFGYIIPLVGLMLDYDATFGQLESTTRGLKEKLFMFEQSQDAFRQKQNVMETLLRTLPDPLFLLDSSQRLTQMNNANVALTGLSASFAGFGKTPAQLLGEELGDEIGKACQSVLVTKEAAATSIAIHPYPDGSHRSLRWVCQPVCDKDERVVAILCVGRNEPAQPQSMAS